MLQRKLMLKGLGRRAFFRNAEPATGHLWSNGENPSPPDQKFLLVSWLVVFFLPFPKRFFLWFDSNTLTGTGGCGEMEILVQCQIRRFLSQTLRITVHRHHQGLSCPVLFRLLFLNVILVVP